eukprot:CAMPEP_0205805604 /NCGR_PEP_ID=MMETSP0205-20121125/8888_1 /ASSEMBLY_ACC=CAM_ASM_000278 /TAXON_ID=36767 /ORGANISM="Euplotes focardii, Strain TN1" /LENGTH=111 /DNA_ID=CAMNT_0053077109 /DNA_START=360 /DNA_END=693 /DNA_ORIENTATION=+
MPDIYTEMNKMGEAFEHNNGAAFGTAQAKTYQIISDVEQGKKVPKWMEVAMEVCLILLKWALLVAPVEALMEASVVLDSEIAILLPEEIPIPTLATPLSETILSLKKKIPL